MKDRLFTLVYKAVQGPAPPTSPGSSPATCPLGDPTPTTEAHTKSISIWGFWMRYSLCMKYLCPRSSPDSYFSSFQSHLQCQLLSEVFLVHTAFSKSSFSTHHCLSHHPVLYPVWHNIFVSCPSPLTGNINFMGAGSALGSTVTPGPHKYCALRKDWLNECLNMAQILEHSQHLRSALKIITV